MKEAHPLLGLGSSVCARNCEVLIVLQTPSAGPKRTAELAQGTCRQRPSGGPGRLLFLPVHARGNYWLAGGATCLLCVRFAQNTVV